MREMQGTLTPSLGWEDPLEEKMATLSSILPWRIQWTEEPGGLPSMGLHRVRHDSSNLAAAESESESHSVMSDFLRPIDYTIHGILQARILEWVAFPFSRGSSQPRD